MAEPFIGQISLFAGTYPPRDWLDCNGQVLPIQQYAALFSILGNTYGGNGTTNFALPDLRGRIAIHPGQGPGLTGNYVQGAAGGTENVTLTAAQMPAHSHNVGSSTGIPGTSATGNATTPGGNILATYSDPNTGAQATPYAAANSTPATPMAAPAASQPTGVAGGGQPHGNLQPYLTLRYCIATQGVFPTRN